MAKILVADDNSNVQKTVALALVELGVEVISVNNGDAAVRKLADIAPDLVLADIFMPVRNGYEVCEFVKKHPRFSNVPVVLLVGAFDPLDEREAQRVGADGILKKPFVPPDPLITMVKTLLDRTLGDRLVSVAASKPAVAVQAKAGGIATAEEHPSAPQATEELPEPEFQPPVNRLSFGEGERPIAFGQLLETPAKDSGATGTGVIDPVDDEQILTSSRDASLGDPIFWRTEEPEKESEEEGSKAEVEISSTPPVRPWKPDEAPLSRSAETEFLQPIEPFELVRDEKDEQAGLTSTVVESSASFVQDAASQASLNVEPGKPADLAANPIEWMASIPPPPAEEIPESIPEWSAAVSDSAGSVEETEAEHLKLAPDPSAQESPVASATLVSASAAPLAIATVPPPAAPSEAPPAAVEPKAKIAEPASDPHKTQPSLKPLVQSAEDTARSIPKEDWADLAASLQAKPSSEPVTEKTKPAAALVAEIPAAATSSTQTSQAIDSPPASPDPVLVEAIVQRILEKMRPQVVDIITKEFLRPIVQALVHREIEKR